LDFEVLFEAPGLPGWDLPPRLTAIYGGSLGFDEPRVFANFVETLDGVVAVPALPSSNKVVAGGSEADRFVLGLLRACCDVLVVGAGTMAAAPGSVWTAAQAFPAEAEAFAELRRRIGRPPSPEIAVISGSGRLDSAHPAFAEGAIVLTTDPGADALKGKLPPERILALGTVVEPAAALAALHDRGHRLVLSEGGPHTFGPWLEAGLVDELFLTFSPLLAGRGPHADPRLALVESADLLEDGPVETRLLAVRREGSHLFLRYEIDTNRRELRSGYTHPAD
jgi:riboflavin biosynthesis pyrimidine reductase